jgi:diamine N-acetyltransferase
MENIIIRKARVEDARNLTVLKQQVWISTYAEEGIRNEFSQYVLAEFTSEQIAGKLGDPRFETWIAMNGEHLVG